MAENQTFDLIILGAGPAGCSSALYGARAGLKVLLLDKASFPRDKICGDAISGKSMQVLSELGLIEEAAKLPGAHIHSVLFSNPKHDQVDIPLQGSKRHGTPTGLVVPRKIFDNFLFEKARTEVADCRTPFQVSDVLLENGQVKGIKGKDLESGMEYKFRAPLVVGADGFSSLVARKTGIFNRDPRHWIVAVRQYYQGVSDLHNQIELHFVDELLPGYFWIFPAGDDLANVGLGIVQSALDKKKIHFKTELDKIVHLPAFAKRFKNAKPLERVAAWNLPVASTHRICHGNGFMLTGDAAGLIDPFTGEGIGNAMISGKHAAETAVKLCAEGRFDAKATAAYDQALWDHIGGELRTSTLLQKIGTNRMLLNLVIRKASRNTDIQELISGMMANKVSKLKLANPLFYLKLMLK